MAAGILSGGIDPPFQQDSDKNRIVPEAVTLKNILIL